MSDSRPGGETLHTPSVEGPQAGMRLDKWLAEALPEISRSRLKALIEEGRVTAEAGEDGAGDGVADDPSRRIRAGERFRVAVPAAAPAEPGAEDIPLVVVYEDDDLIVIDKPPGMVVHPAPGAAEATLVNALLHHCAGSLSGVGGVRRPGIVHRIDKDTSGLLVAAKNDAAHQALAAQFAVHSINRAYLAVCWGVPMPPQGEISGSIGRSPSDRKKMAVVQRGGRAALTRYRVRQAFGQAAALVECRLATGRTHQIRVHMTSIGHPLVGDPVYGRSRQAAIALVPDPAARAALAAFSRQALHAFRLGFSHPKTGERLSFQSHLPSDIKELVDLLRKL